MSAPPRRSTRRRRIHHPDGTSSSPLTRAQQDFSPQDVDTADSALATICHEPDHAVFGSENSHSWPCESGRHTNAHFVCTDCHDTAGPILPLGGVEVLNGQDTLPICNPCVARARRATPCLIRCICIDHGLRWLCSACLGSSELLLHSAARFEEEVRARCEGGAFSAFEAAQVCECGRVVRPLDTVKMCTGCGGWVHDV
ncbi:hypothetical protein LTR28_004542 [Elasticomyces elasticus]|nr:hypothetical protein LTR28_004542 [Elasticomyces elasticus]